MFLYVLAHHKKNRIVGTGFKRSGRTISALDETHVNVMARLGSAADCRILRNAVTRENGLPVPKGNFYFCDNDYTNGEEFSAPFRGTRYHLKERGSGNLATQNKEGFFTMVHSKARNCIERSYCLIEMRWAILRSHSYYPLKVQNRIIMACCLIHNFIRIEMLVDPLEHMIPELVDEQNVKWRQVAVANCSFFEGHHNQSCLETMLSFSFNWNDTAHVITADDDALCNKHIKGEHAEDCNTAADDFLDTSNEKDTRETPLVWPLGAYNNLDDENEPISVCQTEGSGTGTQEKSSSKRKKYIDSVDERMVDMMGQYCTNTNQRLGEIAKCIGYEFDASEKQKVVYEALREISGLTRKQKIYVARMGESSSLQERFELYYMMHV
ncbi:hypothetical protein BUALT_Bualt17G0067500 [Buddleja alternifolia]|uniref:DDE Tnp4 domain-containing protein n=1 Tax=Buddleja alternifolia TaxID=168488 RepID=A0AAV6WF09_9LAMI|nr:hypothetical protein BUALT_Bualt17G0067500 [Buddleja alternifolia]